MPTTVADIGAVILLVLPGFLVYRTATASRADPTIRSALWQLAEILQYSVYVHLLGVGLLLAVASVIGQIGIETHLDEIPRMSLADFLSNHFTEGILLLTLYPIYVVLASSIIGAYDTPHSVSHRTVVIYSWTIRQARKIPLLGWIPQVRTALPPEPIWYATFKTKNPNDLKIWLLVTLKNNDRYHGLLSYSMVPDDTASKDFLIIEAVYYPGGSYELSNAYEIYRATGGSSVLLNTDNVSSIQIQYI